MKKFALTGLAFFLPVLAYAQPTDVTIDSAQDLSTFVIDFINNIGVPLIFAVAFLFFLLGVFKYFVRGAGDKEKRDEGRTMIIYSIIGFFVMISIWGLVHILTGTIQLNNNVPTQGNGLPKATQTGGGSDE
jgi:hypothetical protein